ncbi:hypothetical protein BBP40_010816 [Aspergillus hancockii]|nr:hypothetical protein BBP40_010816 [Aspergillus hancockii]
MAYAVLGATGNCGTALIQHLLQSPVPIHAYCRNKPKLLALIPELADSKQTQIFEGSIHDVSLLTDCLRGTRAAFLVVSTNDNVPGCRMAQDTALGVIRALESLRAQANEVILPKLVLLSSACLDDQLSRDTPRLVRWILLRSASQVYHDLRQAEELLRQQHEWLSTIFIKPGGLSLDVAHGHALSLTEEQSPLSYADLAAAMIEAVEEPDGRWDMRNVGVVSVNGRAKFPAGAPLCIAMGFVRHYLPFLHPYLPSTGPG